MPLVFSVLLLNSGCRPEPEEALLLDCLLETFIDNYPGGIDDVVIISEDQGWTDSSTILGISYYDRKYLYREQDYAQATFKGKTILYGFDVLTEFSDSTHLDFDEARRVKTSINWERFDTTGLRSEEDFMMPPYDPPYAWIVVHNYRQCIEADPQDTLMNKCSVCSPSPLSTIIN